MTAVSWLDFLVPPPVVVCPEVPGLVGGARCALCGVGVQVPPKLPRRFVLVCDPCDTADGW